MVGLYLYPLRMFTLPLRPHEARSFRKETALVLMAFLKNFSLLMVQPAENEGK